MCFLSPRASSTFVVMDFAATEAPEAEDSRRRLFCGEVDMAMSTEDGRRKGEGVT